MLTFFVSFYVKVELSISEVYQHKLFEVLALHGNLTTGQFNVGWKRLDIVFKSTCDGPALGLIGRNSKLHQNKLNIFFDID